VLAAAFVAHNILQHVAAATTTTSPGGGGRYNCEVSCNWRFQPPNTLPKQEGLRLAEASFRDNNINNINIIIIIIIICLTLFETVDD
jgi:hypothetical protein